MGEKIVVGPVNKGLKTDRTAFNIDNDSFPVLVNAYQWRGRVKRKRGTSFLGRLNRFLISTDLLGDAAFTLPALLPIPTGISQFVVGTNIFTDPGGASPVVLLTNGPGTATLDRLTGVLTITGSIPSTQVKYFPGFPVLGLEEFVVTGTQFPGMLAFDTTYSYNVPVNTPANLYDVSFYKNEPSATYPGYVAKPTWTRTNWNGKDYQQFWSANYQGAFWVTNGIPDPFDVTKIGMQYKRCGIAGAVSASVTDVTFTTTTNHPFVEGDFVFVNEFVGITGLNSQTGYVLGVPAPTAITFRARFPTATVQFPGTGDSGIVQALTSMCQPTTNGFDSSHDSLRWYDGDPMGGVPPNPSSKFGWVNFAPPLVAGPTNTFSIDDETPGQYYLVGAKMIVPFKDRLLFLGPVIQTSADNSQVYLEDTVIYSQNGTPYYTCSFPYSTVTPTASIIPTLNTLPILLPPKQTASPASFWEDATGYGGFVTSGLSQPINTVNENQDVLVMGFSNKFAKFVYTGNDILPFLFYIINSELGALSTFSSINLDRGGITFGNFGICLTSQVGAQRIDLQIPDQIFQLNYENNGVQRVCSERDYINEWIYFTYPSDQLEYKFPNQTLLYNYRDESWAVFNEAYTTYGIFRHFEATSEDGLIWATVGQTFPTWSQWNQPWDSGAEVALMPKVVAGNQQGYILTRDDGTPESESLVIQNFVASVVSSPNHCLNNGDYIIINGALGTVGPMVNGKIFQVTVPTNDTFTLNQAVVGTYLGGGVIKRMYVPLIQTKQFPPSWGIGRKTRIGPQMYLFTTTAVSQITLLIFLSQNGADAYNDPDEANDALVYSSVLFTCPESTNLGLTAANTNLQMLTASAQSQIWHRMNSSLIGDTVQIGFTLSNAQMTNPDFLNQFAEIELHGFILDVSPSQMLS